MRTPYIKGVWVFIFVGALALFLAACAPAREAAVPAPAKLEPKYGGSFKLAARTGPVQLNPYTGASYPENITFWWTHESLITFDYKPEEDYRIDYKPVPWLAESWEQPNPSTYLFKLRKGVKWHDGRDFSADDVVFSYNFMRDPEQKFGVVVANLADADKIEKVDDYTVRITTKMPSAEFLQKLAQSEMRLLPKHLYDAGGAKRFLETPVIGTGPFVMVTYDNLRGATYQKNKDYWLKARPYLDSAEVFYGMEDSAMLASFTAKKTDAVTVNDRPQLEALRASLPDLRYLAIISPYNYSLFLKLDKAPYSDIRVRRAIHLAIDRQALIKTVVFGEGVIQPPAGLSIKKGWNIPEEELLKAPGWRQPKDEDLAEAKRLLTEAGYPNGFKTSIRLIKTWTTVPAIMEMIAGQLKKVGIEAVAEGMDMGMFRDYQRQGNYEIFTDTGAWALPDRMLNQYYHSKASVNKMPIKDAKLDQLIEAEMQEMDVEKRKKLIIETQRLVWENLYSIPTIDWVMYAAWQPWVHDYIPNYGSQQYVIHPEVLWVEAEKIPSR